MANKDKKKKVVASFPPPENREAARAKADLALRPSANAAAALMEYSDTFGEQDVCMLMQQLIASMDELEKGNLRRCENMLFGQAHVLQSIFVNLSRRAANQEYLKNYETYLRLALKAQSQCRATLETLAMLKNPPIVYAKQANIAQGHQQINNGVTQASHAENNENEQNKLLEQQHEQRLDSGKKATASPVDPAMATVETLNGANIHRR